MVAGSHVTPLQGLEYSYTLDPGRCPGLSYLAPLGLDLEELNLLTTLSKTRLFSEFYSEARLSRMRSRLALHIVAEKDSPNEA